MSFLEQLESRRLCTGNVYVASTAEGISIAGDDQPSELIIVPDDNGSGDPPLGLVMTTLSRTNLFVNGELQGTKGDRVRLTGENGGLPLTLDMRGGNDYVDIQTNNSAPAFDVVRANLGEGDDRLNFRDVALQAAVEIDAGGGDDYVSLIGSAVGGNLSVFMGGGRDRLVLASATRAGNSFDRYAGKLWIADAGGPLSIVSDRISIAKEVLVSTSNSIDRLAFTNCSFSRNVQILTRGGDDTIDITGSSFKAGKDIQPGTGANTILD